MYRAYFFISCLCAILAPRPGLALQDTVFIESEIALHTPTGDIAGTLTLPDTEERVPVALIIAGSGPTDRDGNSPATFNNSLKFLAYALAGAGIATVRYDKRGVGESSGAALYEAELRFEDYVNDARAWVDLLLHDRRFSSVIIIGHSEGSLIGMLASSSADKFISVAGAGYPADQVLREQLGTQTQGIQDLSFPILDSLKAGKTIANVNPMLYALFRPSVQPYMISWFRYDPGIEIGKLENPVLIVQGTKDLQVTPEDARRLAQGNPSAQLIFIEDMNHIFKLVRLDAEENIATYSNPMLPIADALSDHIVHFVFEEK